MPHPRISHGCACGHSLEGKHAAPTPKRDTYGPCTWVQPTSSVREPITVTCPCREGWPIESRFVLGQKVVMNNRGTDVPRAARFVHTVQAIEHIHGDSHAYLLDAPTATSRPLRWSEDWLTEA